MGFKSRNHIPNGAIFNADEQQWELGETDGKGKRIGEWKFWWSTTKHHCATSLYEQGGSKETFTRFHPDGTYSQKAILLNGKIMPNSTVYMQKSRNKTTELALQVPVYANVFRVEEFYIRPGESLWKNFNDKGQRIDLDGDLLLTVEDYVTNFPGYKLPRILELLVEFQNQVGAECYSEGFALGTDDNSFLALWSKEPKFTSKLMHLANANGTGSVYCVWNDGSSKQLAELPIVIFGDEGGEHVVAGNLLELLQILRYDVEPMVSHDSVDFTKCDYEPRPAIVAFRKFLKDNCGISKTPDPRQIYDRAQTNHKARFDQWKETFF